MKRKTKSPSIEQGTGAAGVRRRDAQLRRMIRFAEMLHQGKTPSAAEFARLLEKHARGGDRGEAVCARTIRRDIEWLKQRWGAPIEFDPARGGYCLTETKWELPFLEVAQDDLLPTLFAGNVAAQIVPPNLLPHLEQVRSTLVASCGRPAGELTEALNSVVLATGLNVRMDAEVSRTVVAAWNEARRLRVRYGTGRGNEHLYEIEPHALFFSEGAWYVRAKELADKKLEPTGKSGRAGKQVPRQTSPTPKSGMLSLALHRIRSAELLPETFARNPQFIAELGSGRLFDFQMVQDVVVRCSGRHAAFTSWIRERVWHPKQTITDLPDGGVELCLPEVSRMWLIRWVLAFGGHVTIEAPADARDELAARCKQILNAHGFTTLNKVPDIVSAW